MSSGYSTNDHLIGHSAILLERMYGRTLANINFFSRNAVARYRCPVEDATLGCYRTGTLDRAHHDVFAAFLRSVPPPLRTPEGINYPPGRWRLRSIDAGGPGPTAQPERSRRERGEERSPVAFAKDRRADTETGNNRHPSLPRLVSSGGWADLCGSRCS